MSAKRIPRLLEFRATYEVEPTPGSAGVVRIEKPEGDTLYAGQDDASARISRILDRPVVLDNFAHRDEKASIDRNTVFGDIPVSQPKPDWTLETMPDYFQLKSGSFLEIGAVFLLASGSVGQLRCLQGGTALIDRRRFRPNLYIDTGQVSGRFVEDDWLGGKLTIGDSVVLGEFAPRLWCVGSTLTQEELPRDRSILRTIARGHQGCLASTDRWHRRAWSGSVIPLCSPTHDTGVSAVLLRTVIWSDAPSGSGSWSRSAGLLATGYAPDQRCNHPGRRIMSNPGWHTGAFPELRPGPPWVMQEMIAAQPALVEALLTSPPPGTSAAAEAIAAALGHNHPVIVCGAEPPSTPRTESPR